MVFLFPFPPSKYSSQALGGGGPGRLPIVEFGREHGGEDEEEGGCVWQDHIPSSSLGLWAPGPFFAFWGNRGAWRSGASTE